MLHNRMTEIVFTGKNATQQQWMRLFLQEIMLHNSNGSDCIYTKECYTIAMDEIVFTGKNATQ